MQGEPLGKVLSTIQVLFFFVCLFFYGKKIIAQAFAHPKNHAQPEFHALENCPAAPTPTPIVQLLKCPSPYYNVGQGTLNSLHKLAHDKPLTNLTVQAIKRYSKVRESHNCYCYGDCVYCCCFVAHVRG